MSDYVVTTSWYIKVENVSDFVNVDQIVPRLRSILSSASFKELDERKRLAVRTFLDTYDGKIKDVFFMKIKLIFIKWAYTEQTKLHYKR